MPFMKIRTSFPAAVLSIIILVLFGAAFLSFGVMEIFFPHGPPPGVTRPVGASAEMPFLAYVMCSAIIGIGLACLLAAIAVGRGSFGKGANRHDRTRLFQ